MSLHRGTDIDQVRDHLAILYVLTLNPDRHTQHFDRLFAAGQQEAEKVLREDVLAQPRKWREDMPVQPAVIGWRETYGHSNTDHTGTPLKEAFNRKDIERVENRIIELANAHVEPVHYPPKSTEPNKEADEIDTKEANEIASYALFGDGYEYNNPQPDPDNTPLHGTLVFDRTSDPSHEDRYTITLDGKTASHDTWATLAAEIKKLLRADYDIRHDLSTAVTVTNHQKYLEMEHEEEEEEFQPEDGAPPDEEEQ